VADRPSIETDLSCGAAGCAHYRQGQFSGERKVVVQVPRCAKATRATVRIPGRGTWRRCPDFVDQALAIDAALEEGESGGT
jgi:hypothetical protein